MANPEHLAILQQGVDVWNQWLMENKSIVADLSEADLEEADLSKANLKRANLWRANLVRANLSQADLSGADLTYANLYKANLFATWLSHANLIRANLSKARLQEAILLGAYLDEANLSSADLSRAVLRFAKMSNSNLTEANLPNTNLSDTNLSGADLSRANLVAATVLNSNFRNAILIGCKVYGISVWNVNLTNTIQKDLIISASDQSIMTVDNLAVAQFIYLLLNNPNIRNVVDTITTKAVLILGRFTKERKAVLDSLREALRYKNYLPILFDFENSENRNFTETISTLAHLARFVIADITEASSIPQELKSILPHLPSVAVQPILQKGYMEYGMFDDFNDYPWLLPLIEYESQNALLADLSTKIIEPAEAKVTSVVTSRKQRKSSKKT